MFVLTADVILLFTSLRIWQSIVFVFVRLKLLRTDTRTLYGRWECTVINCLPRARSRRSAEAGLSPPVPFVSVQIDRYAGGLASPASHSKVDQQFRGQGGNDSTSNLPSSSSNGSIPSAQKLLWLHPLCGHRAAMLENVMPTLMMDDGFPPPRDELSTSCAIYCLWKRIVFLLSILWFYVTGVLVRVIIPPPYLETSADQLK